ncbi:PHA/PHB synthase family protein [Pseudaestuariivita rosea]|uniref:PHA/PHB synthase family protein n=1 Tax=Pseudaestuariivita rosea TaxID=2763263 RepID=UPI001ABA31F4|nr:alpha/beta fold hydrolase [Pseudaestuariivita rosea]
MKDLAAEQNEATEHARVDVAVHSAIGQFTGGLSPSALATSCLDWWMHLAGSPAKQADLTSLALQNAATMMMDLMTPALRHQNEDITDKRFRDVEWQTYPFSLYSKWFLMQQDWWQAATTGLHGVEPEHERIVSFAARQVLDTLSPSNYPTTNPVVLKRTLEERGANIQRGFENWIEDFNHILSGAPKPQTDYIVGESIAVTPGQVIYRNRLIELIRYTPATEKLHPEPILIVPAWIMKYYILDLSPQNSLIKYLCDQGYEVFAISWKNPDQDDADLGMQDYVDLGVRAALDQIAPAGSDRRIHAAGYCLGGTLLSIMAAAMARDGDDRLATVTLMASQVDFSEAGELSLFINESQVSFLEDIMKTQGYLSADQMSGAFQMLRSNDLIWSRLIRHYLLGERTAMNDLMAWNADTTRMPAKMHSQYLRSLFLRNALARGQYKVDRKTIALTDIKTPVFSVATEKDHVSPWKSVYKISRLTDTELTFLLTNGGHNGGILSEPGHPHRHYRLSKLNHGQPHLTPEQWFDQTEPENGSWWPVWTQWLDSHSSAAGIPDARIYPNMAAAPGTYVFG